MLVLTLAVAVDAIHEVVAAAEEKAEVTGPTGPRVSRR